MYKMKEAESLTGLNKQTIIYYEKENLIAPKRMENGTREFSKEQIAMLKEIRTLREMQIPIEQIRQCQQGETTPEELFQNQMETLEEKSMQLNKKKHAAGFYLNTDVPVDIDADKIYKKDVPVKKMKPFHAGPLPSRKMVIFLIGVNAAMSLFLLLCAINFCLHFSGPLWIKALGFMAYPILILYGGACIPQIGLLTCLDRYTQTVKFSRDTMEYLKADTMKEKLIALKHILKNEPYLTPVLYEEIRNVQVIYNQRYIMLNNFAYDLILPSFYFVFKNGEQYKVLDVILLPQNEEMVLHILRSKVERFKVTNSALLQMRNNEKQTAVCNEKNS